MIVPISLMSLRTQTSLGEVPWYSFSPLEAGHRCTRSHFVVSGLVCTYYRYRIGFTTPDTEGLPLPVQEYLHAACAKVVHVSRAAEYIEKILDELEDVRMLSEDGASAEPHEYALRSSSHEVRVN